MDTLMDTNSAHRDLNRHKEIEDICLATKFFSRVMVIISLCITEPA